MIKFTKKRNSRRIGPPLHKGVRKFRTRSFEPARTKSKKEYDQLTSFDQNFLP